MVRCAIAATAIVSSARLVAGTYESNSASAAAVVALTYIADAHQPLAQSGL